MTPRSLSLFGLFLLGGCSDLDAEDSPVTTPRDGTLCGGFAFVDETSRLPDTPLPIPGGVNTDTLDVELVDLDGDDDLDLWFGEGSAGPFGFPHKVLVNNGAGEFAGRIGDPGGSDAGRQHERGRVCRCRLRRRPRRGRPRTSPCSRRLHRLCSSRSPAETSC